MQTSFLNKVPEATLVFWLIKMMSTTVGETGADFLAFNLHLGIDVTCYLMSGLLAIVLFIQLRASQYTPSLYWLAVVLISIVGTLITDNLVDNFHVALETTTILFSGALAATFAIWYASEKTLSIHSITSVKRELFYWGAILFTFALGTSAGDLVAERYGIGYAPAAILFGSAIAIVAIGYYLFKLNGVLCFWIAYVLTRPLGSSLGDWLIQAPKDGGLGLSTMHTSIAFITLIIGMVAYLTVQERKHVRIV